MRYAVLSDIHANLEALTAVLDEVSRCDVDRIVGLGDFVGYHADPNGCLDLLRRHGVEAIAGNHDLVAVGRTTADLFSRRARLAIDWTAGRLETTHRQYLAALPEQAVIDGSFVIFHGSLRSPHQYVRTPDQALEVFHDLRRDYRSSRLCFFGHTHRPVVYRWDGGGSAAVEVLPADEVRLEDSGWYAINPGSVGQSRDADPRASFLVYDSSERLIRFHRVAYDYEGCMRKARAAGLVPGRGRGLGLLRRMLGMVRSRRRSGSSGGRRAGSRT